MPGGGYVRRLFGSRLVQIGGVTSCVLLAYLLAPRVETQPEKMNLSKLATTQVKSLATGEMTSLGALWADQPTVVTFLRRFG